MNFDITWTITAVIAVSSFLSPVVVSWMNNKHHYKMRKLELQSDLINNQISTLYNDKLTSYKKFIEVAGQYSMYSDSGRTYTKVNASLHESMILCDEITYPLLLEFQNKMDSFSRDRESYNALFTEISKSFNRELFTLLPEKIN